MVFHLFFFVFFKKKENGLYLMHAAAAVAMACAQNELFDIHSLLIFFFCAARCPI